jgi:hypothetical protein
MILTLQATKAKEEDFDQLLSLESRFSGLPPDFVLAKRGRKLIGYGSVLRVYPNSFPNMMTSSRSSVSSSVSSASSPWDTATSSFACRISSFSVSSVSSSAPSRSGSLRMSPSAFSTSPKRPSVYRSPSSASSTNGNDSSRPSTPSGRRRSKDELALFIFDDLVILASPSDKAGMFSSKSKKDKGWKVLSETEGGVGKLFEVKDWSGFGGKPYYMPVRFTLICQAMPRCSFSRSFPYLLSSGNPSSLQRSASLFPRRPRQAELRERHH